MMNNVENYIVLFNTFTNHVISSLFDRMCVLMRSIHPSFRLEINHILKVKLGFLKCIV